MVKLSIIVPVYNEEMHIERVLEWIIATPLPEGVEKEIIVVNDGSTDRTEEIVQGVASLFREVEVHTFDSNQGKGSAIREGLKHATGDIILTQDGDLEYDPHDYSRLIQPILDRRADVVYGSRFLGSPRGMHLINLVANKVLVHLANLLYRAQITDEATAYKAFRKEALSEIELKCVRFEFCPEVTAKLCKRGHKILEVPVTYDGRSTAQGKKIGWRDGLEAIWTLLKYRFTE